MEHGTLPRLTRVPEGMLGAYWRRRIVFAASAGGTERDSKAGYTEQAGMVNVAASGIFAST